MKIFKGDKKDKVTEKLSSSYVLAENWKSELDFYSDELNFLTMLISKYFILLLGEEDFPSLPKLVDRLKETKKVREELLKDVMEYMSKVKMLLTNDLNPKDFNAKKEHVKLETSLTLFSRSFRSLKGQVFSRIEEVTEHEKVKRLIQA